MSGVKEGTQLSVHAKGRVLPSLSPAALKTYAGCWSGTSSHSSTAARLVGVSNVRAYFSTNSVAAA